MNNSARDRQVKHMGIWSLGKLFTFCSVYKLFFTSWLLVVVSGADKNFEVVQNGLQTTLKQRKTWWNPKPLGCLFTKLTWACFEVPFSSLRTSAVRETFYHHQHNLKNSYCNIACCLSLERWLILFLYNLDLAIW